MAKATSKNVFVEVVSGGNDAVAADLQRLIAADPRGFGAIATRDFPAILAHKEASGEAPGMEFLAEKFADVYANENQRERTSGSKPRDLRKAADWQVYRKYNSVANKFSRTGVKPFPPAYRAIKTILAKLIQHTDGLVVGRTSGASLANVAIESDGSTSSVEALDQLL